MFLVFISVYARRQYPLQNRHRHTPHCLRCENEKWSYAKFKTQMKIRKEVINHSTLFWETDSTFQNKNEVVLKKER